MNNLRDAEVAGKKVLMRVDFNVPRDKDGNISDDAKMTAALPTIEYILHNGGKLILISHLGRPKGKVNEKYSLKKVASHLEDLISAVVKMTGDLTSAETKKMVDALEPGEVLVLENIRFYPGEEKNDDDFAKQLASLGDIYVNDAFGTAHRAHASTAGVAKYLPAYAGFLMEKEVEMLNKVIASPESPRMAIMGGAKIADKIGLIDNFLDKLDTIIIGGGMANTFLKAMNKNIGKSICADELLQEATRLLKKAQQKGVKLLLPVDVVVASEISADAKSSVVGVDNVSDEVMILDIGPKTAHDFVEQISKAKTIVWNGPLGVYEYDQFAEGTNSIARAVAACSAVSVIGGGESAAAVHKLGLEEGITHISTGGGATLEFLEGKKLPGVAACEN
ncbi:MAG: phosphoglycerate kinase [Syntrophomonadaceae bacterium]|nr:phosphoglycerate kinase [Syntrophomonadaceae bacterium]